MTAITPTTPTTSRRSPLAAVRAVRAFAATTGGTGTQFDYLYNAIIAQNPGLAPAEGTYFQFAAAPPEANWVLPDDAIAYALADGVPAHLDGFYSPTGSFSAAYASLLRSIRPTNNNANPDYTACQMTINDLENTMATTVAGAKADYNVAVANSPGTWASFQAWLVAPFGGAVWQAKLNTATNNLAEASTKLAAIVASMDAPLSTALSNLGSDQMNISTGGPSVSVPRTTISGKVADDKTRWDTYQPGQFDFDSGPMDSETKIAGPWQTVVTTSVSHSCSGTSISQSIDTSRIVTDEHYSLRVQAVGFQSYTIKRGNWYDESFVNANVQLSPGGVFTNDTFFAQDGTLHMIPNVIVVMYKPTITMTMSTQVYQQEIVQNANANLGVIPLFGYNYQVSSLADLKPVGDAVTTTITFTPPQNSAPQVLGVISKSVWNGHRPIGN